MHVSDTFLNSLLASIILYASDTVANLRASHRRKLTNNNEALSKSLGTAFPTPSTLKCDDTDGEFYNPDTSMTEPCIWLQDRPYLIPTICKIGSEARTVCPETCGSCFDECIDYTNKFIINNIRRNCEWLRIRPGHQKIYCTVGHDAYYTCPETCNACDGVEFPSLAPSYFPSNGPTFNSETSVPSVNPSISLSPTESPTLQFCDDTDGTFFAPSSSQNEPCIWLKARPELLLIVCTEGSEASRVCPETCGVCTDSCKDTEYSFVINNVKRDCEWLRIRPGLFPSFCKPNGAAYNVCPETCNICDGKPPCKDTDMIFWIPSTGKYEHCPWLQDRLSSISDYCTPESEAIIACPETCGKCDHEPSGEMHLAPERPLSTTPLPTSSLREPTLPSLSIPSPTSSPTTLICDDDYENLFSVDSIQQYQGCLWLAARPNFQVTLCDPLDPSHAFDICEETCGKCSDRCNDTNQNFIVKGVQRDCSWLLHRPGHQEELCVKGNVALLACPETCNACESLVDERETHSPQMPVPPIHTAPNRPTSICEDNFESFFFVESIQQQQGCIWLAARETFQNTLCNPLDPSGAFNICEETCGKCSDECNDTNSKFLVNGVPRDCTWLLLRPGDQERLCVNGNEAMLVCSETCNVCETNIDNQVEPSQTPSIKTNSFCDDSDGLFFAPQTNQYEPCIWLEDRPEFWATLCVENSDASLVCQETCGTCVDNCEDTAGKFQIGSARRDCKWLKLRPGMKESFCYVGSEAYRICPETCNACDG